MKIRKGSLVKYKNTKPEYDTSLIGVVVSNPKEVQFKFSKTMYALKLAVDVLFNDNQLFTQVLIEDLELIKI